MNKKVSIIVPVYNVALYLEECLTSLINQTYQNIEIILVDDGSTDNSYEICKTFESKDSRVVLIHKENGGAASARNLALDYSTGDYICFVDSDDYVDINYVSRLVEELEKNNADVAICSYYNLNKKETIQYNYEFENKIFIDEEFIKRFLTDWTSALIWNKIFKREIIENHRFPTGHKIDDEFFTYKCMMNCKQVYFFNEPLYIYRLRKSSVMNDSNKELILKDRLQYLTERYDEVVIKYPNLKKEYLENLMDNFINIKREIKDKKLKEIYKKYIFKYMKNILVSNISFKQKVVFGVCQICNSKIKTNNFTYTNMYFE